MTCCFCSEQFHPTWITCRLPLRSRGPEALLGGRAIDLMGTGQTSLAAFFAGEAVPQLDRRRKAEPVAQAVEPAAQG